jgi:hypothetical protein
MFFYIIFFIYFNTLMLKIIKSKCKNIFAITVFKNTLLIAFVSFKKYVLVKKLWNKYLHAK